MNSYSSSSSDILFKRFRLWKRQYLHVVIYTSLFWIFVDVFFIMLFSDCTKEVIIPCSSSLIVNDNEMNNNNNNIKLNDDQFPRHPKFNLHQTNEKNLTILDRKNIINRKKNDKSKKPSGSFIAQWFASGSGLKENLKEKGILILFLVIIGTNPSSWPGEGGRAVVIPTHLREEAKKRFKENQFNIVASDLMALNRSINDQRSSRFIIYFNIHFYS
jgi:hypothetical protein